MQRYKPGSDQFDRFITPSDSVKCPNNGYRNKVATGNEPKAVAILAEGYE
jgi:hypothetical protein